MLGASSGEIRCCYVRSRSGAVRAGGVGRGPSHRPRYRTSSSKHLFTQPQLLAILCLMRYEDWTYREAEVRLAEHSELRRALQLRSVPDFTTLYRFLRCLDEAAISRALHEVVHRFPLPGPCRRTHVAVDATGLSPGAISTFFVRRMLRADARLWAATEAIAAADYHAPIAAETKSSPNAATTIDDLNLSVRTAGRLKKAGLKTAGEVGTYTAEELMMLCGLGQKSIRELAEELQKLGITLLQK